MRTHSDGYERSYRSSNLKPVVEVSSWYDGELLAEDIPVVGGTVTETLTEPVPGVAELNVPGIEEWLPVNHLHPLANKGQQLRIRRGYMNSSGEVPDWFDLGLHRIYRARPDGDAITVRADSLEKNIEYARFTQPTTLGTSTMQGTIRFLLSGILPVAFDPSLTDRATKAQTWERERLEGLTDVLAAWPAVGRVDESGVFYVEPAPTDTDPVAHYTDADTLVSATSDTSSDGVPNAVTAATAPEDGSTPIYETIYNTGGPLRWGGPYGYQPAFYASPLLTTRAQLKAAATTRLRSMQLREVTVTAEILTDPRLQLGDVIAATSTADGIDVIGRVIQLVHGLTPEDEPGSVTLSVLSGVVDGEEI